MYAKIYKSGYLKYIKKRKQKQYVKLTYIKHLNCFDLFNIIYFIIKKYLK